MSDDLIADGPIDDEYLLELRRKLNQVKNQRKQCEKSNAILISRVNCLKNEQEKAQKKIEMTKKKTEEKLRMQENHENLLNEKKRRLAEKEKEINELRKRNLSMKLESMKNMVNRKNELIVYNKEEAKLRKEQQKQNEELINYLKEEEINNRKSFAEFIKSQQIASHQRKLANDIERKDSIKNELERKIEIEINLKSEIDNDIEMLKQTEMELLNKIAAVRAMHKQLVDEFQFTIYDNGDNNNNNDVSVGGGYSRVNSMFSNSLIAGQKITPDKRRDQEMQRGESENLMGCSAYGGSSGILKGNNNKNNNKYNSANNVNEFQYNI